MKGFLSLPPPPKWVPVGHSLVIFGPFARELGLSCGISSPDFQTEEGDSLSIPQNGSPTARGQPYRKGVLLSLSQAGDTDNGALIPGTASSEAFPWGSNLVSGASVGAIKVAAEFMDFCVAANNDAAGSSNILGSDPMRSRLDRSDGGVRPVFEGVAVNNAGSSNV